MTDKATELLKIAADKIRETMFPNTDQEVITLALYTAKDKMEHDLIGVRDMDREYFETLDDLHELFAYPITLESITELQAGIDWDNWHKEGDCENEYWSLGDVYYSKMDFIVDECGNKEVVTMVKLIQEPVRDILNELETELITQ